MKNAEMKLTLKGFSHSEEKESEARELFEKLRWSDGVACPRCGSMDIVKIEANTGKKVRKGLYRCRDCRKLKQKDQFTFTVGTIFEDSHIPLDIWLQAIILMCSSKKGISAHQLHRQFHLQYRSAWFMAHRIRFAMAQTRFPKLGGTIEADETYVGGKSRRIGSQTGWENKTPVVSLVQRGGKVRSFVVEPVSASNLKRVLTENISPSANLMTDELPAYKKVGLMFNSHQSVNHRKEEYVRGDVTTNTVEGYFGLLKRGINGTFHHVSKEHLHRYLAEFDFRYNNRKIEDAERTQKLLGRFEGKRLTYRDSRKQTHGKENKNEKP